MSKRTTFAMRARRLRAERRRALPICPHAGLAGLAALLYETQSDSFTVSASNLVRSTAYTVSLSAATAGGSDVSGNDVGFNSTCSETAKR